MNKTKILGPAPKTVDLNSMIKTADSLFNQDSGFGGSLDKTANSFWLSNSLNSNYESLAKMYEYWLPRRVVDLIPDEGTRNGWNHVIPSWNEDQLKQLADKDREFKVIQNFNKAWKWERLFGGSILVYLFDQSQGLYSEPIDKDNIKEGSLLGIDVYDPWQSYPAEIELYDFTSPNYRRPKNYTLGTPGFMMVNKSGLSEADKSNPNSMNGAIIDQSRLVRFPGLTLPYYSLQNNFYWGQSLLSSVSESIAGADRIVQSVGQLVYKLSVPVMKVPDIMSIITDDVARGGFMERINLLNTCMSNNNMAVIDSAEDLSNLEQSGITGLDPLIERFFVLVSAASGIPVSKLVGESARGLNATGEGDEKNFFNTVESEREDKLLPRLDEFYDIFFPAVMGIPRPADHKIEFPSLFQESPGEIAATESVQVDTLSRLYNDGVIDLEVYMEEVRERKILQNLSKKDKDRILNESFEDPKDLDDSLELGGSASGDQKNPYT